MNTDPPPKLSYVGRIENFPDEIAKGFAAGEPPPCSAELLANLPAAKKRLLEDSKTFCILPWTHLIVHETGQVLPCCRAVPSARTGNVAQDTLARIWNGPELKRLRLNMLAERKSPQCQFCYEIEESGVVSMRMANNRLITDEFDRVGGTRPDGSLEPFRLRSIELNLSNVCNFKCRYCGPERSTAWHDDHVHVFGPQGQPGLAQARPDLDSLLGELDDVLPHLSHIHFAGGEPLLLRWHYDLLRRLVEARRFDIELSYSTNFSEMSLGGVNVLELWNRFENVKVGASLDAAGKKAEYVRKGQDWPQVLRNVEELRRRCPKVYFHLSPVLSVFNAFEFPRFHREWLEAGYIDPGRIDLGILQEPHEYRIQILPKKLKRAAEQEYSRHIVYLEGRFGEQAARDIQTFRGCIEFMWKQDLSVLLPRFREITARLDARRSEKFEDVFPEMAELMF